MPQSHVSCLIHIVFGTEDRRACLSPEIQENLYPYLGGIARNLKAKVIAIGGAGDHVHMLISIPPTLDISTAVQKIKGSSSKWINDTYPGQMKFRWQKGYGAFSISVSGVDSTIKYIKSQQEHHRKKTFKEEIDEFLKAHGMDPDA